MPRKPQTPASLVEHCRQSITTRYAGPSDSRGSRVIAKCDAGRITVPWDHALNAPDNHAAAALQLHHKLGWHLHNRLAMGAAKDHCVFVQVPIRK